jgi:cell division protein FtsB
MPQQRKSTTSRPADWDPVLRALLFWSFVGVALLLFAACLLLPEWRQTEQYAARLEARQRRVDELRRRVVAQERTLEALRSDPLIIARLAERELRYRRPDEEEVFLPASTANIVQEGMRVPEFAPAAVGYLPPWLAARLPRGSWIRVFYDSPDREVCLTMAGVLFVTAFWIYPPQRRPQAGRRTRHKPRRA